MYIRDAKADDLETIMKIYADAREFQKKTGNPNQWIGGYPPRTLVEEDLAGNHCKVCVEDEEIVGVFAFFWEADPTYQVIYDGEWLNDRPYSTIHRIASSGTKKGVASFCFQWAMEHGYQNVRIDTHNDNVVMQHVLDKNGFVYCGEIVTMNGTMRRAYQKSRES